MQKVRQTLGDAVDYRRVEVVGPRVSSELLAYGTVGLMLAIMAILIYLWFRFEWQFALGAMIANGAPGVGPVSERPPRWSWPSHSGSSSRRSTGQHR